MSNHQPPKKKSAKKKSAKQSKTSSTKPSEHLSASDIEALKSLASMVQPVVDFHKASEGACMDDIRVFWDVRIVRGRDEHFAATTGSSSLPGALSSKLKANAPAMIQQEIVDKVAAPLVAAMQNEAERQNKERMLLLEQSEDKTPTAGASGGTDAMDIASDNAYIPEDDEGDEEEGDFG